MHPIAVDSLAVVEALHDCDALQPVESATL